MIIMFNILIIFVSIIYNTFAYNLEDGNLLTAERIVKSPWNVDKLSSDDIRCFCNLPVCVPTSYMCRTGRSESGGCFSEVHESMESPNDGRHGCVELIADSENKVKCNNSPQKNSPSQINREINKTDTLFLCCQEDMCNHVDNKKKIKLNLVPENNDTIRLYQHLDSIPIVNYNENHERITDYNASNEFWFKLATILVPLLGAIILFILIAFAIRMLKHDSAYDNNSKLDSPHIGSRKIVIDFDNSNQSPLLKDHTHSGFHQQNLTNHLHPPTHVNSDKKNETQAKINQLLHLEYSLLPQSCHDPNIKLTNTELMGGISGTGYRNINLSSKQANRDINDKIYEKEILNAVTVNWPKNSVDSKK